MIDVCALPCVNQITSENLLHSPERSAWCFVVTEMYGMGVEGWEGGSRGRGYS